MSDPPDPARNPKPDAVLFPTGWEPPGPWTGDGRITRLSRHFESLLGATPGQTAHVREVGGGTWLASLSLFDGLLYPDSHRLAKFPRYDWITMPDGLRYGYLKPDHDGGAPG
jgi:hypothetical protein